MPVEEDHLNLPQNPLPASPSSTLSFSEACERTLLFDQKEEDQLQTTGHTRLFTQGHRTERVAILLHGITNNPLQWEAFGQDLHADGWNVLVPRLLHHGFKDRLTPLPGKLRAEDMIHYTTESIDIAHGLGDKIAIVGLSAGGVYAAWAAQNCPDIALTVLLAPFFGLHGCPIWLTPLITNIFRWLPNQMRWWNSQQKDKYPPLHAYPKYSTHGLAETLRLGEWVYRQARETAPPSQDIVVINNAADVAINNAATDAVAAAWKRHDAYVATYVFGTTYALPHDLIDMTQPKGQTKLVYGKLREILNRV